MDLTTYYNLLRYLENKTFGELITETQQQRIIQQAKHFVVQNGLLFKINRRKDAVHPLRVLKENEIESIMKYMHEDPLSGHFGFNGTYQRIAIKYWWNGMGTDIKDFVKSCPVCQFTGSRTFKEPLHPIKVGQPFDHIVIDLIGPNKITQNNNRYIITAIDYLTKWPEAKAVPTKEATEVAKFIFEEIICRHGCPKIIQSDQGTEFTNNIIKELTQRFNIQHRFSTSYHPQTNGIVERFNRTLTSALKKYCIEFQEEWDTNIPAALFAYRTLQNSTTKHEPFFLTYGREARIPIELQFTTFEETPIEIEEQLLNRIYKLVEHLPDQIHNATTSIHQSQERSKERYDSKLPKVEYYEIGDKVLLYDMKQHVKHGDKFKSQWYSEWFYIHETFSNGTYKLRNQQGQVLKKKFHSNQLKIFHERQPLFKPEVVIDLIEPPFINN